MDSQLGPSNTRLVQGTVSSVSSMRQTLPSGYETQAAMVPFLPPGTNVQYPMHPGYPLYLAPVWPAGQIQPGNDAPHQSSPPSSDDADTRPSSDTSTRSPSSIGSAQRTLFIAGLPSDVKEREIFNLLRFQPGFVDCSLTPSSNGKQAVAFASWRDHETASRCRDLLQGLRFDPFGSVSYLRVQFARSESKTRRTPVEGTQEAHVSTDMSSPFEILTCYARGFMFDVGVAFPSPAPPPSSWSSTTTVASSTPLGATETSSYGYFQSTSSSSAGTESASSPPHQTTGSPGGSHGGPGGLTSSATSEVVSSSSSSTTHHHRTSLSPRSATPTSSRQDTRVTSSRSGLGGSRSRPSVASSAAKPSSSSASPLELSLSSTSSVPLSSSSSSTKPSSRSACPTLFVTNLGMLTTEQDLTELFRSSSGFHRLRFQLNTEGLPICFVDFDSELNSSVARDHFQGYLLHHTPLRIEFAKQKMKRVRKR